jgi:hypothetical protein
MTEVNLILTVIGICLVCLWRYEAFMRVEVEKERDHFRSRCYEADKRLLDILTEDQ